jgi:hypothetical protein
LGISTFTQQALRYDNIYPYSESALLPVAQFLNGTGKVFAEGSQTLVGVDLEMASAVYTGIFSREDVEFVPKASCDTSNCTWEPYQTLAVCNTCEDLTSKLERSKERVGHALNGETLDSRYTTNYYNLPDINFTLTGTQLFEPKSPAEAAIMNITTSRKLDSAKGAASVAFQNNGSKLMSFFAIGPAPGTIPEQPDFNSTRYNMTGNPFAPPVAYECLLQFCIRTYRAEFIGGKLNETIV